MHVLVPDNFTQVLSEFTSSGYRVIALAYKPLESKLTWPKAQRIKREQVRDQLLPSTIILLLSFFCFFFFFNKKNNGFI